MFWDSLIAIRENPATCWAIDLAFLNDNLLLLNCNLHPFPARQICLSDLSFVFSVHDWCHCFVFCCSNFNLMTTIAHCLLILFFGVPGIWTPNSNSRFEKPDPLFFLTHRWFLKNFHFVFLHPQFVFGTGICFLFQEIFKIDHSANEFPVTSAFIFPKTQNIFGNFLKFPNWSCLSVPGSSHGKMGFSAPTIYFRHQNLFFCSGKF